MFGLKLDFKVMSEHNTTENKTTCTKQSTPILLPTSDTCETAEKSHNMLLKYIMQHILSTITTHQPQDRIKTLQEVNNNNNNEQITTAATTVVATVRVTVTVQVTVTATTRITSLRSKYKQQPP